MDGKSYINILICYVGYVTPNSVKPLYLIIHKINGYIEKSNENKYLTVDPADKSKGALKKYEELWDKVRYLFRSTSNNSDVMIRNI